jgi:demethylspheroidene O-methyltransferase
MMVVEVLPKPGLLARLLAWRDARLVDPRFRRWAASFPLTRPIARRRARALFDLVAGFTYSQVLLACVRLRLFEGLVDGPAPLSRLAPRLGLTPEAASRLLDAAVALRLLERRAGGVGDPRYGLGPLGAPMVDNPALAAMVEHHALLYADLADPVALLRSLPGRTALSRYWPYADGRSARMLDDGQVGDYSALMAASQPLVAEEILDAYDIGRHRCLLDVGGGEGVFASTVAGRWPKLRLMVFDLPAVAARANARFAASGIEGRAKAIGGDFSTDDLPEGADLISLVRVVHDHDDDTVLRLLRAARRALTPDGALLIAEPMAETRGARAMGDAYFGLYLWAMGSGRPRSAEALGALLISAGFTAPRLLRNRMPLQTRILVARPAPGRQPGRPDVTLA